MRSRWAFVLVISILSLVSPVLGQLSNPITRDSHAYDAENKFIQRTATPDAEGLTPLDEEEKHNSRCPSGIELRWQAEVASSIYSTPVIADINGDGKSEVIVPSFVHYLEVLEGADGEKLPGWPSYHKSSAHTSPLLYDVDEDGMQEVLLATYNGEVLVFHHTGEMSDEKLVVPRLKVRKDWFAGLDPDHVDHAHPDIEAPILDDEPALTGDAAKAAGLPDHLLNLPHREDPRLDKPAAANSTGGGLPEAAAGKEDEPHMPDHLPDEPVNVATSQNATDDCADDTCTAKGHKPVQNLLNSTSGTGSVDGTVSAAGTNAPADVGLGGSALANGTVTAGSQNETIAKPADVAAMGLASGEAQGAGAGEGGAHTGAIQGGGALGGAGSDHQIDQVVTAGGDMAQAAVQGEAVRPAEVNPEQRAMQESWERWHAELEAKNHTMTAEQQQKWDHFVAWREKQRQEGHGRRLLQAGGGVNSHADEKKEAEDKEDPEATVEPEGDLDEEAAASWDVFKDEDEGLEEGIDDEYHYDYDDEANQPDMWADEDWTETDHETDQEFVAIDSHILCTPVVGDIDKDGDVELVVAASYFFDREYYEDPAHKDEIEEGLDVGKYIAGAIVVFDLHTKKMKWNVHLDLTTESTQFRAYIYSAPTIVDIDRDGYMEILVGTSVGFIYCLDHNGTPREGFPIQMGEIQGQIIAADINHDGLMEIVAADTKGNVAVFDIHGKEVWERHTASLIAQGATVGDVDGDGQLEVVVTTTSGHVWVFNGVNGEDHGAFPYRTHGRIMVPALLVDLKKDKKAQGGLQIVVISFDGYLYIIDGQTGCADAVDVGETSYSMVLADQVDGGDDLDLIVSTMNGNVYCFQTPAPYHPLKAWSSQNQGANVPFPRYGTEGVYFLPQSRQFRDLSTTSFSLQFEIVDRRPPAQEVHEGGLGANLRGPYEVSVWLLVHGARNLFHHKVYDRPGVYTVNVKCPMYKTFATIRIEMLDEHKAHFSDEFSVSFHMFFHRILKWILVLPLLGMLAALVVRSPPHSLDGAALPSFRGSRYLP